jgi:hypothetical protein
MLWKIPSQWYFMALVGLGATLVLVPTLWQASALGGWQLPIYVGCLLAVSALLLLRRERGQVDQALEELRLKLRDQEAAVARRQEELAQIRAAMEKELLEEAARLDRREQALQSRLVTYHEWMEFPRPVDLSAPRSGASTAELVAKDKALLELLRQQTAQLYDNILQNKYAAGGKVLIGPIRDDLVALVTRVAQIYQPQVQQPLLEASLEDIFRAISRASLQLLAALDELPVDVQRASLSTLYAYVQTAVRTWRMYKSAEPYWPYVNTAYYLGRLALGASPVTMGTWWFLSHLGKRGAQALAQHLVNRQALALLSNLVRIVGYEAASVFGGDFRHRDANWIYGAELTELVQAFPLSRESLSHALHEIGSLQLRSEYDRMYLYRCLAVRQSAHPERYVACELLSVEERRAVADRLERFLERFIHGKTPARLARWREGVEARLGVKLAAGEAAAAEPRDQIADALRSLASFLVAVKQLEPPEAAQRLKASKLVAELSPADAAQLLDELASHASYFFEYPDLDPDSVWTDRYLQELALVQASVPPRSGEMETLVVEAGVYLRRTRRTMEAYLEEAYALELARHVAPGGCPRRLPRAAACAVLDLAGESEQPLQFVYPAQIEGEAAGASVPGSGLWLVGRADRLWLVAAGPLPQVLWQAGPGEVRLEQGRTLLAATCRLSGGRWERVGRDGSAIRLSSGLLAGPGWFQPLVDWCHRSAPPPPGPPPAPEQRREATGPVAARESGAVERAPGEPAQRGPAPR